MMIYRCPSCGRKNRVPASASRPPRCGHCHKPLAWLAEATDETFAAVVEQSPVPVLVDLWAAWCGPCRMVSPALEQIAGELAGRLKLAKIDVDANPGLSQRFAVQSSPTLMLLHGDRVLARQSGARPVDALRVWVRESVDVLPGDAPAQGRR